MIPAIGFGILKLCGFSGILLNIPVIMLGMPVAANVTIMAAFYNSDSYLAARLVFVSTLLSVISIPIIALFLL